GVQTLVEDAVAVAIEPQDLEPIAAPAREHEHRAALGIERHALLDGKREGVKRAAHILALGANEDANRGRYQRRLSRTSSKRLRAAASNDAGTRTRTLDASTTSSGSVRGAATSTNVSAGDRFAATTRDLRPRRLSATTFFESAPRRHFHHDSECA